MATKEEERLRLLVANLETEVKTKGEAATLSRSSIHYTVPKNLGNIGTISNYILDHVVICEFCGFNG
jgi:hypothetical protein